jgi:4'-phosphopantetheinyl transferase
VTAVDVWLGARGLAGSVLRDPRGAPYIPGGPHLSISHSGALEAVAVCELPVGVDVERIRPLRALALARRFFPPVEADALAALPEAERDAAFLRLWTAKEAYVKALGTGFRGSTTPRSVAIGPEWALAELALDGYCGTVAVRTRRIVLRVRDARQEAMT